jgi:uncharacterized protein YabN with tetrapyrrole methylase and pyrophosphatase domain
MFIPALEDTMNTEQDLLKIVEKQEIAAKNFGFYWEGDHQILEQIRSECLEIEEAWQQQDRANLQEEVGDLLQAAISLAVFYGLDPTETLKKSTQKFQQRFDLLVKLAQEEGYQDFHQQPIKLQLAYWDRVKNAHLE